MIFKKKQNRIKSIIFSQTSYFLIGLIVLALIAHPLSKKIFQRYRLNKEVRELNEEIKKMESHNKDLKNLITYLESKNFTEEEARLNLNLKKAGEEVVIIKGKNSEGEKEAVSAVQQASIAKREAKDEIYPKRWWKYFFK